MLPESEEALRRRLKSIGMKLSISTTELADIEKASAILLRTNLCFARFVGQSGAKADGYVLPPIKGITESPFDCVSQY
jgi:hypothetical protein